MNLLAETIYTDKELLSLIAESDRSAFEKLYQRYWVELYDAAYRRLKNAPQSEDIVQDIFIRLWMRRETLNIENLPAYLHTSVRYMVYNYVNRDAVAVTFYEPFEAMAPFQDNADAGIIQDDLLRLIYAYIDTLPEKRRNIFNLYFVENLSTKEIAERLKISQKTVQNQLGRAMQGLRSQLAIIILVVFTNS